MILARFPQARANVVKRTALTSFFMLIYPQYLINNSGEIWKGKYSGFYPSLV